MKLGCLIAAGVLMLTSLQGQNVAESSDFNSKFYFHWGYNRSFYWDSDIQFKGEGFDFELHGVRAEDGPEPWNARVYLNPVQLTIPQFNFRVGYFIDEKHSISLGWDHMKYHIIDYQQVQITGFIDPARFKEYSGEFDQQYIQIQPEFIQYEHSDGFNFLRAAVDRREELWKNKTNRIAASWVGGVSLGATIPWTDFHFMGEYYRNWLHLAGWGVSAQMALRLEIGRLFFVQGQGQWGQTWLYDIVIQNESTARAKQNIQFIERSIAAGFFIGKNPGKKNTAIAE